MTNSPEQLREGHRAHSGRIRREQAQEWRRRHGITDSDLTVSRKSASIAVRDAIETDHEEALRIERPALPVRIPGENLITPDDVDAAYAANRFLDYVLTPSGRGRWVESFLFFVDSLRRQGQRDVRDAALWMSGAMRYAMYEPGSSGSTKARLSRLQAVHAAGSYLMYHRGGLTLMAPTRALNADSPLDVDFDLPVV